MICGFALKNMLKRKERKERGHMCEEQPGMGWLSATENRRKEGGRRGEGEELSVGEPQGWDVMQTDAQS